MKVKDKRKLSPLFFFIISVLTIYLAFTGGSQVARAAYRERGFLLFFKYPSITVSTQEKIKLDLMVINTGEKEEQILLSVVPEKKAQDWDTGLEVRYPTMEVHSVGLLTKEPNDSMSLKFRAIPPENVKEGKYEFVVKGATADGKITHSANLTINLKKRKAPKKEKVSKKVKLTADYPSIENPAGEKFKFTIKAKNSTDKPVAVDLGADYPRGWRAYVSPKWEEDKRISSIKIDANGSQNLVFTLTPPGDVSKGNYPVKFAAKYQDTVESIDLKATVTGTYKLKMRTKTGRLNLDAIAGEQESINLYLWNEGSASIEDVSFLATDTPKDWKVSFDPEKISSISPYQEVEKPDKVKLSITPPPRTLPGDYMFTLKAAGRQDQNQANLRVTVKRSTMWGWAGIGIVVVIIASLVGIFMKLGRR